MMRAIVVASCFGALVGCSTATSTDAPPVLEVTSPARGTTSQGDQVTVTGRVMDDHKGVQVTINGTQVSPFPAWEPALEPGRYIVRLEVKDDNGKVSVKELDLTVIEVAMPDDDDILPNQTTNQTDQPDDEADRTVLYFVLAVLTLIAVAALVALLV